MRPRERAFLAEGTASVKALGSRHGGGGVREVRAGDGEGRVVGDGAEGEDGYGGI